MINITPDYKKRKSIKIKKQVVDFLTNGGVIQNCRLGESGSNSCPWRIKKTKPNKKGIK